MIKRDLLNEMGFLWFNVSLSEDTQTEKAFISWLEEQEPCPETAEEALRAFFVAQGQQAAESLPTLYEKSGESGTEKEIRARWKKNPPRFPGDKR